MRALTAGAPATLFKINLDTGHGGAFGRYDYLREIAFDYAWTLRTG
jgi:oligopeptidase B